MTKDPTIFKPTIDHLYTVKTDGDLYDLMNTLVGVAWKVLEEGEQSGSMTSIDYIVAISSLATLKTYFMVKESCTIDDSTIIAFNMAEYLETVQSGYVTALKLKQRGKNNE